MTGFFIDVAIGIIVVLFSKKLIIDPLFNLDERITDRRNKKRIEDTKKLPLMTQDRANNLLGRK